MEYELNVLSHHFKVVVGDPQRAALLEPGAEVEVYIPEQRLSIVDH